MKIAEALIERKRIQQFMEQTKERVISQAKIYEGDNTSDDVELLINDILEASKTFEQLTKNINFTNQNIKVRDGSVSIADVIAEKDSLQFTRKKLQQIYKEAAEKVDRYRTSTEIRIISTIDLPQLREVIDSQTNNINKLNIELQKYNWENDLVNIQN